MMKEKSGGRGGQVVRVRLIIEGRVQGVFFRASTRSMAASLGVAGWVHNLPDGSVEAVAEGEVDSVERLVEWCHKGPPGAFVTAVHVERQTATGEFNSFDMRYY